MARLPVMALGLVLACAVMVWSDETPEESIEGTWLPVKAELGGKEFPDEIRKTISLEVKGDEYTVTVGQQTDRGTCKLDASTKPRSLDITGTEGPNKGKTILAIYDRQKETLRVCYDLTGKSRPEEFKTTAGSQLFLVEYKLKKE